MYKLRGLLLGLLCLGVAAGCTTNLNPGNLQFTTQATLQMAVGTVNDGFATLDAVAGTYLNVVTTFRNQFGNSAFEVPGASTLTLPGGSTQLLGSLFQYGKGPRNNGVAKAATGGLKPTYTPPNTTSGGAYATGYILGAINPATGLFTTSGLAPLVGAYSLTVAVPVNGITATYTASATLPAGPPALPAESAPSYVATGATGGGTFTITKPAGVTESLIVVKRAATGALVATVETTTTTATLPAGTLTPGLTYTAFVMGADYPLVEAGAPFDLTPNPTIAGTGGTADLTVSAPAGFTG